MYIFLLTGCELKTKIRQKFDLKITIKILKSKNIPGHFQHWTAGWLKAHLWDILAD